MGRKSREAKTTEAKLKEAAPEFLDEVNTMDRDQLRSRIVTLAKEAEEVRKAQALDADIKAARDQLKVMNESYKGPLKIMAMKTKFLVERLDEKGG